MLVSDCRCVGTKHWPQVDSFSPVCFIHINSVVFTVFYSSILIRVIAKLCHYEILLIATKYSPNSITSILLKKCLKPGLRPGFERIADLVADLVARSQIMEFGPMASTYCLDVRACV